MTTPATTNKPKSPATPSYTLKDSQGDAKKLYSRFSHASFSQAEIASALGLSSSSSSFTKRVFALTEYGLLHRAGDKFTVSRSFHTLDDGDNTKPEFQGAAVGAIRHSSVLAELLADFKTKLPPEDTVAQRLERARGFNAQRARDVARVLQNSLAFAGVLDQNNNILPVREESSPQAEDDSNAETDVTRIDLAAATAPKGNVRKTEIPLADGRIAIVHYPHDLSALEATKIGKVLSALVE